MIMAVGLRLCDANGANYQGERTKGVRMLAVMTRRPIASYLHEYLLTTGRTEAQVADLLGVDQTQISRWVRGVTVPRPANLEAIAELLGVSVEELEEARERSEEVRRELVATRETSPEVQLSEVQAELKKARARIRRLEDRLRRQ